MNAPATTSPSGWQPSAPADLASLDLIRTLVGFDTTSRDSNLALIDWVRDYLAGHGFASTLTFDDDRRKANLFATARRARRQCHRRRHRAFGPYRRRAGRRPAVGHPIRSRSPSRDGRLYGRGVTDMKSFSAVGLSFVPEFVRRGVAQAAAFRAVVRRGSRLHRRAAPDRRHRRARHPPGGLHRRRAHRHGARGRAQGQEGVALPRARLRGAFVADAARRECGADRLRDRRVHRAARARVPRRRARATTRTTCPTRRRTSASSAAAPRSTSCRATARSTSRSATCRSTTPTPSSRDVEAFAARFLPEMHAVDPAHLHRVRSRCRRCPASTRTTAATSRALGHACNAHDGRRQGVVRHRGVAVPRRRRFPR